MTDNNENGNTKNFEKEDSDSESDWSYISDDIDDELNNVNLYFYFKINFHQV